MIFYFENVCVKSNRKNKVIYVYTLQLANGILHFQILSTVVYKFIVILFVNRTVYTFFEICRVHIDKKRLNKKS